jgi:hypothetical protein
MRATLALIPSGVGAKIIIWLHPMAGGPAGSLKWFSVNSL